MYICIPLPDIDYTINLYNVILTAFGFLISVFIALHVAHKSARNAAYYSLRAAFSSAIVRCEEIDAYSDEQNLNSLNLDLESFFIQQYKQQRVAIEQFKSFAKDRERYDQEADKYIKYYERMFKRELHKDQNSGQNMVKIIERVVNPIKKEKYKVLKEEIKRFLDSIDQITCVRWYEIS